MKAKWRMPVGQYKDEKRGVFENMNESSKTGNSTNRDFTISFIQVVSALAVVTLHTNGCFWQFSSTERYWFTANIIESVFYFSVPVFFMLTGITLIDYQDRYSTKIYFRKRIEKTLLPYVAWSLIAVGFKVITHRITTEDFSIKWLINGLINTSGIINIYWFFGPLFCIYLAIPLFASIEKTKKKRIAEYLILVGMVVNILVPFLNSALNLGIEWVYSVSVISDYLFWVIGGYYFHNYPPSRKQKGMIIVLSIIGLLMHIIGTYILSVQTGTIAFTYKGYNNLPCVLYTFGVYVILRDVAGMIAEVKWLRGLFQVLGKYTFSLYLIHWFVLELMGDFVDFDRRSIIYRLFAPYIITIIVIGFVWCLRKIPGVRRIVP